MPDYYRATANEPLDNVVLAKISELPEGWRCVVSWLLPQPGLRTFNPTRSDPDAPGQALPYAQFLLDHLDADRVVVDLDDGVEWNPAWGALLG